MSHRVQIHLRGATERNWFCVFYELKGLVAADHHLLWFRERFPISHKIQATKSWHRPAWSEPSVCVVFACINHIIYILRRIVCHTNFPSASLGKFYLFFLRFLLIHWKPFRNESTQFAAYDDIVGFVRHFNGVISVEIVDLWPRIKWSISSTSRTRRRKWEKWNSFYYLRRCQTHANASDYIATMAFLDSKTFPFNNNKFYYYFKWWMRHHRRGQNKKKMLRIRSI